MRAAIGSFLLLVGMLEAVAQPGPSGKLPPQASDKAQEKVAAKTAPAVSMTAPVAGALYTAPAAVVLQASASASSSGKSITQVEFFAGATAIGIATAAPYTFSWNNVAAGSYSLTARATDNLGATAISAPVTITVNAPPSVTLASPTSGAVFTAPASVTLSASAADSDGTVSQLEFFQGSTLLATVTSAPYTFSANNLSGGTYSFTARATDNRGASVTSASATVLVNVAPTITLASPANNATFTAPASITLTAEVADTDGAIAQVDFFNGATLVATRITAPYSVVLTDVPQGAHSLSARVTDNHGAVATSAAVSVTVNSAVAQIYFIHTDHLNTPRLITNNVGQAVWSWNNDDPFGANVPNQNPSALGDFECNLRLPGQYFDRETNLRYNYFRDYDSGSGRYIQSDPIGLQAGINTYAHVLNNPLSYIDPFGLDINVCFFADAAAGFGHIGYGVGAEQKTFGYYPTGNLFSSPGQIQEDVQKNKECKIIQSNPDQDRCMLECRARTASNPGTYNLSTRQCTSFVRDCLKECGLPTGNFRGNPPWRFYQQLPAKK
jgi:RHS repeat-associated protein